MSAESHEELATSTGRSLAAGLERQRQEIKAMPAAARLELRADEELEKVAEPNGENEPS